ncbi:hypothetical protein DFH11DRAFT_1721771 [Phellopilus nigrolimitatus]|nr:hypothetical protein DFH11DRAFT_1721771 [Phellopilus nigrolimitatus]
MAAYYAQRTSVPYALVSPRRHSSRRRQACTKMCSASAAPRRSPARGSYVADAVHAQGPYIYLQLCMTTRPDILAGPDSPSNALDVSNKRTDRWGGSIKIRRRFVLEALKKTANVVGRYALVRSTSYKRARESTFAHLVRRIREMHLGFAIIHVVEPRVAGEHERAPQADESNDFLRATWKTPESKANGSIYVAARRYKPETTLETVETKGDFVVSGRYYISNPNLPMQIRKGHTVYTT